MLLYGTGQFMSTAAISMLVRNPTYSIFSSARARTDLMFTLHTQNTNGRFLGAVPHRS